MNIMTIGSCLSIGIAKALTDFTNHKRISSVQHNRIDQFVNCYINRTKCNLTKKNNDIQIKEEYLATNVLQNQIIDWELGKSLPRASDNLIEPLKAIQQKSVDLLIIDNFPEIYFKLYNSKVRNMTLFLNNAYFEEIPEDFIMDPSLVCINNYIECLNEFITYVKNNNQNLKIVIVNFPVNLNPKESVRKRAKEIELSLNKKFDEHEDLYIIPAQGLYRSDLSKPSDIHHFSYERYLQYALMVSGLLKLWEKNL